MSNRKSKVSQDSPKLIRLKQELLKWEGLNLLSHNQEYRTYLKPLLQAAFHNKWPDPAQEDFDRKYIIEFSRAKAYEEIYNMLEMAETMIKSLTKQMKDPQKNYEI
jgi:hypothetical protein